MIAPTPEEQEVLYRLRNAVHHAHYPSVYYASREDVETVDNYFKRAQAANPESWIYFHGPNGGVRFKGCELLEDRR